MKLSIDARVFRQVAGAGAVALVLAFLSSCRSHLVVAKPSIEITQIPASGVGGPTEMADIAGRAHNATAGQQIVLYAHGGLWWIQPLTNEPFTRIQADSTWKNATHLGTEYAALLVDSGYQPESKLVSLPQVGNGVAAIATAQGKSAGKDSDSLIRFSGYDWAVRSTTSDRGGEPNAYDTANAWTDEHNDLHMRMGQRNGQWSCAEISLTHSLGYGTYRFVVDNTGSLSPSAVLGLFVWDNSRSEGFHNEFDIELSRWDDPKVKNAQYVVQPFYVPENLLRFESPAGPVTHTFTWEPGKLTFRSFRGTTASPGNQINEHSFNAGIPSPANEAVHVSLYDFHHTQHASGTGAEIVIHSFEFSPLQH